MIALLMEDPDSMVRTFEIVDFIWFYIINRHCFYISFPVVKENPILCFIGKKLPKKLVVSKFFNHAKNSLVVKHELKNAKATKDLVVKTKYNDAKNSLVVEHNIKN